MLSRTFSTNNFLESFLLIFGQNKYINLWRYWTIFFNKTDFSLWKFWKNCLWGLNFSSHLLNWLCSYLQLWFKQTHSLKIQHIPTHSFDNPAHSCTIHEMYDYGWSKLMICWIIDSIIDTCSWSKVNQYH